MCSNVKKHDSHCFYQKDNKKNSDVWGLWPVIACILSSLDGKQLDNITMDDGQTFSPKIIGKWKFWCQRLSAPSIKFSLLSFHLVSWSQNHPTAPLLNITINSLVEIGLHCTRHQGCIKLPGPIPYVIMHPGVRRS